MRSEDGHSYDRASIEHWFRSCREEGRSITSPKTNARLPGTNLIPNITLRGAIDAYNEAVAKLRETLQLAEAPAEGEAGPADGGAGGEAEGLAGGGGYSAEPGAAEWRRARGMPGFDLRPEAAPAPAPAVGGGAAATDTAAASEDAAVGPYRREGTPHRHWMCKCFEKLTNTCACLLQSSRTWSMTRGSGRR